MAGRSFAPEIVLVEMPSGDLIEMTREDVQRIQSNKIDIASLFNSLPRERLNMFKQEDIQAFIDYSNTVQQREVKPVAANTPTGQETLNQMRETEPSQPNTTTVYKAPARGPEVSNTVTDTSIPQEGQALLNVIAGHESRGSYNIIVGEGKAIPGAPASFDDYSQHPRVIGMRTDAGPSTAAGRYQITATTWDDVRGRNKDLTDFSPINQDRAAWQLAQERYKAKTGNDLLSDLQSGNYQRVGKALSPTWAALQGKDITGELNNLLGQ